MKAFDFTENDLANNRIGKLSPRQADRYKRSNTWGKVLFFFLMLGFGVGTYFTLGPILLKNLSIHDHLGQFIGGVILDGLALLFLYFLFEKESPVIRSVQGPVQFVTREAEMPGADGQTYHSTRYYVVIDGHEFDVGSDRYPLFKQGHIYAIYSEVFIGILSVEYIGPPAE